jgi:dihydrolipoamide dehydrogenase
VSEQLGQAGLAVVWGASPAELAGLVQPHPTLSEVYGEALLALAGRGLHT